MSIRHAQGRPVRLAQGGPVRLAQGRPVRIPQGRQKVIAIVGPTASGKTALGLSLARTCGGEIISADSRQIYRGMDIIAGTPGKKETGAIPYHLLRIADPNRQWSAGRFAKEAARLIGMIYHTNRIPIVVGGTGFWADALLLGVELPEVAPDKALRAKLAKKSAAELHAMLKKLDPRRAASIDPHNPVRLIRAIEIAKALGRVPELANAPRYDTLWLGLAPEEATLRRNIHARIEKRLRRGALTEAARLRAALSKKRFGELGAEFSLFADCLDKKISRAELAEKLERWELAYAKRQLRWLRRNLGIRWVRSKREAEGLARAFLKS